MTSGMKRIAVAILLVGLTGCHIFGKRKPAPTQTPPPPAPIAELKPPPPKVEQPGPPPKIEAKVSEIPAAVDVIPTPPAPKPKHHKQPKKPVTMPAGTQPKEGEVVENVATPPTTSAVPKLGEILSDDQRLENLKICDESVGRAKQALAQIRNVSLNASQKESVARIRTFISQAEQARQRDPQTARQLAERADLLSRDLVKTVR